MMAFSVPVQSCRLACSTDGTIGLYWLLDHIIATRVPRTFWEETTTIYQEFTLIYENNSDMICNT